jgi:hypothetical protein
MTQEHRIAPLPPQRLMQQWIDDYFNGCPIRGSIAGLEAYMAARGAEWGANEANRNIERERQEAADEELEACIEVIKDHGWFANPEHRVAELRAARRPKLLSSKELALEELEQLRRDAKSMGMGFDAPVIRRALEQLPDDQ